jgi:inositol-phosphate phosphatase / L-galactose 1-phosphate phosphatase / histidinol-phosphatase
VTTRNGTDCQVRSTQSLAESVLSASSPDFFYAPVEKQVLHSFVQQSAWRIYGGAAMSYGRLASGRIDIALDAGLKIYDYAPFVPIIQGAGGVITDWEGNALHLRSGGRVLAAANKTLHTQALSLIRAVAP